MKITKQNKGFALAFSLLFLLLAVSFIEVYFFVANSGMTTAKRTADAKRAYYAADAGLAEAFMQLRTYSAPPASFSVADNNYTMGTKSGTYSATAASSGGTWPIITINSTGTFGGVSKTLVLTLQEIAASKYAYLSNSEYHPVYGNLWWITGMTTVGPVHTNGRFNIYGDPVYQGPVSQVNATVNYYHGGPPLDNPDFQGGLTLGAPAQAVFNSTVLTNIQAAASAAGGLLLSGNSTITFNSDATINVTNAAQGWTNQNMPMPANLAIYVQSGSATVNGVVNGQVSVGSDNNVYISGHLMYNTDPRVYPTSTDILALVANQDITVTLAAPNNLEIDSVMVAINGSFQVDQFWVGNRGNMIQFGSLVNNVSGPTGIFDPETSTLYGGYNQLQYYDVRLKDTIVPPWFPPAVDASNRPAYTKISLVEL